MLPENNKTTAKADSDCVHKIAFLKEVSEEFGTKPPPFKGLVKPLRSSASSLADSAGIATRTQPCAWPGVLDPVLQHVDVHILDDGVFRVAQLPSRACWALFLEGRVRLGRAW